MPVARSGQSQAMMAVHGRNRNQVAQPADLCKFGCVCDAVGPYYRKAATCPCTGPAGDIRTIPLSMAGRRNQSYPLGKCFDDADSPGSGSILFYINTWAMPWPTDYHEANYFYFSDSESESDQDCMALDESESKDDGHGPRASDSSVIDWDRE
jgi:hypothetical protein